jgi:hypothetical protein
LDKEVVDKHHKMMYCKRVNFSRGLVIETLTPPNSPAELIIDGSRGNEVNKAPIVKRYNPAFVTQNSWFDSKWARQFDRSEKVVYAVILMHAPYSILLTRS